MDPLTAFSLACGVIQVVDFSAKLLSECRKIYKEGSLSEYRDLEDLTKHLVEACAKLDLSDANQSVGSFVTADEQSLLEVAGQCSRTADLLVEKLRSLKTEGPRDKRRAVVKTVKLLWERGDIQELQKQLDGYRSALDTQILISLRQRLNLISPQLSDLDKKVQTLIHSLSQGSKFEELKDLIQMESKTLGEQFNSTFHQHERRQEEKEYRTQLLDSLWFAEILSREETIAEAHSETFQWIFDKSGQAVRPWDNFSAWLETGEGIYWINGKAGSGKSTLMSFLCQDERTIEELRVWSETKDLLMPKFYFWSSGTTMQKRFEGLLRSLLWQILKESLNTNISPVTFRSIPELNRGTALGRGSIGVWTRRRLQRTLQEAISQLQSSYRLCFFLDGLDEFDEDHDELITFVREIVSKTGVKVCLSSRPYKIFEDAFRSSAKLRLQDLTHKDVRKYVEDKFQDVPQLASMTRGNGSEMNKLKDNIVAKAEGVFLWVKLAVKDQIRGLRNEDSPEQLQERLAALPSEVEGIYLKMLPEIEQFYRQEAAHYLQVTLYNPELSLLGHTLGSYEDLENMLISDHNVPTQKLASLCRLTRKKIITRCAGLLEVYEPSHQGTVSEAAGNWGSEPDSRQLNATRREIVADSRPEEEIELPNLKAETHGQSSGSEPEITDVEDLKLQFHTRVSFIHRTAVDFLENTGPGRKFLEDSLTLEFDPQIFAIKASLGILRLLGPMSNLANSDSYEIQFHNYNELSLDRIDGIMIEVANAEDRAGRPQTRLCELVDRTMSITDRLHPKWRPNTHWCMRWGNLKEMHNLEQAYTTSSSRSSSTESFDSATSEFPTFDRANATPTDSTRFLGFAASHNLVYYVQHMLDCREKNVSPETLDYLLCCSILAYQSFSWLGSASIDLSGPSKVVLELLRRGADPNANFYARTIWRRFLERTVEQWARRFLSEYEGKWSGFWFRSSQTLISSIIAFLENGADMGAIWTFHFAVSVWYEFDIQLSVLCALRLVLRYTQEFPRIQEMCTANGSSLYSRCTIFQARFKDSTEEPSGTFYVKQYELSEPESEQFVAILEHFAVVVSNNVEEDIAHFEEDLAHFQGQLREFSEHLDVVRSDNSNSSRMKTSIARESWGGSEWYTHKSFFDPNTFVSRYSTRINGPQRFYDAPSSPPQRHDPDSSLGD